MLSWGVNEEKKSNCASAFIPFWEKASNKGFLFEEGQQCSFIINHVEPELHCFFFSLRRLRKYEQHVLESSWAKHPSHALTAPNHLSS